MCVYPPEEDERYSQDKERVMPRTDPTGPLAPPPAPPYARKYFGHGGLGPQERKACKKPSYPYV
jgi:hypothetical protein